MNLEKFNPVALEAPKPKERTWAYPWIGLLLGVFMGVVVGHPLSMLADHFYGFLHGGAAFDVRDVVIQSFHPDMWPMIVLFAGFGGISWAIIGFIIMHLRENRLRLDTLHQEFELQVATLRHHYKNLALGIHGFSSRIKGKMDDLEEQFRQCGQDHPEVYERFHQDFESVQRGIAVLEDASQRLSQTLGQELTFLRALTSDSLGQVTRDFYPFLVDAIQELLGLRFREKEIKVEINGRALEDCQDTLVFAFEPYTMEVILQNVIGNAMKNGDHVKIQVTEKGNRVLVEVRDNGPGMDVEKLKYLLSAHWDRREAESTHLGLKVSLHLLEKSGGRLLAGNNPEGGAAFIIEIPRHPAKVL